MQLPNAHELFLGKYQLELVLGEGGFARVFGATEIALGRAVALKVLKPTETGYAPGTRARFDREVRIIANLTDRHTVTLYDWGETDEGLLYLVFEFIDGRDLVDVLRKEGTIPEASVARILDQVLQSLREAHRQSLLHRDIKPHNIRIYEYGGDPLCVKVLDFGIAKPTKTTGAEITAQGMLVGSPRYMAPEQLFERELDPRSDLYSLGLVTFEMLLGRAALPGSSLNDQLPRLTGKEALRIPHDAPVSPKMRAIVDRLLQHEPSARFATADDVLVALHERPTEPLPALLPVSAIVALEPPEPPRPVRPVAPRVPTETIEAAPKSARWPWIALACAVAVLVGLAIALLKREDEPAPPPPVARRVTTRPAPPPQQLHSADVGSADASPAAPANSVDGCGRRAPFSGRGALTEITGLEKVSWVAFIPRAYDPNVRHQVLMLFHEDLESPAASLDLTGFETYADQRNIVILVPQDHEIRAWRGFDEVRDAKAVYDLSAQQLCLDDRRVLAFGHSTGGRAVERLPCVMAIQAAASSSHRPEIGERFCDPAPPIPYLHIAPLKDGYDPIEGGSNCGVGKVSLADFEDRWRTRNECTTRKDTVRLDGGKCSRWSCEASFVSCRASGGHRWPGQTRRAADLQDCDGGAMTLPISKIVWEFFDSVSG